MTLNLSAPTSWSELSQQQLTFLLKTIVTVQQENNFIPFSSKEDFSTQIFAQVALRCLFHWNNISIVTPYNQSWIISHNGSQYTVSPADIAPALSVMQWISQAPDIPVRLDVIDGAQALPPDIEDDISFDDFLACEACWQVWQSSQSDEILREMAAILYRKKEISLQPFEYLSIFYWWAALKNLFAFRYPDFFQPDPNNSAPIPPDPLSLRRNMDAQIRALTKGDITKESTILALPAARALTELNALAKEFDQINRKFNSK